MMNYEIPMVRTCMDLDLLEINFHGLRLFHENHEIKNIHLENSCPHDMNMLHVSFCFISSPNVRWHGLEKISGYTNKAQPFEAPRNVAIACFYISVFLFFEMAWEYSSAVLYPEQGDYK